MIFNSKEDLGRKSFLDKKKILEYVTEEDIFEIVFGFKPKEFQYVTSPFRKDNHANCWFEYAPNGKLRFKDFANSNTVYGIKMINIDCFDAVQVYYKLPNFYMALEVIKKKLILNQKIDLEAVRKKRILKRKKRKQVLISIETRQYTTKDKDFWEQYGITKQNLIDDGVFAVKNYEVKNGKFSDYKTRTYDICYAYTEFDDNRKKLYRPRQKGKKRFLTTCKAEDIGGINKLIPNGTNLIITKSYKDYRVLKNQNLNVIWFQNEGMVPSKKQILDLCERFTYITIFFDNDESGLKAADKVTNLINSYCPGKCGYIYIPKPLLHKGVTDPSDFYSKYGKELLVQFLSQKNLL